MADSSRCDLPYGQYGPIEYLPNDKSLSFGRRVQLPTVATPLGEPKVIDAPPHADRLVEKPGNGEPRGKRHARQIKALVDAFPEFEPGSSLLSPLLEVAEAAEHAQSYHDPLAGSLITFTNIRSQVRHRALPVMAMRTGTTGCTLRVSQLEMQRHGWAEDKTTWLERSILGSDETTWSSSAGIIQQLLFAEETGHRDSLLAVRLTTKVIVFKVIIAKGSVKMGTQSGLKLQTVFESHGDISPECSYMDVAFNPWFSQQIAVIDSAGEWQVIEVSSGKVRHSSVICKGTSQVGTEGAAFGDGWARIAWISDMATIATCTRQRLTVFSIRDAEPMMLGEVPVQLAGNVPWILGFKKIPGNMQRLALLTSTHLLSYHITRAEPEGLRVASELNARHYQDTEDLSLSLTSFANDEELSLGVYSSKHNTLSMHRLWRSLTGHLVSSDPYSFTIPSSNFQAFNGCSIRDLHIRPIRLFRKHEDTAGHGPAQSSNAAEYYTLHVIRRNGIIEESLCHVQATMNPLSVETPTMPSWSSKTLFTTTKVSSVDAMVDDSILEQDGVQAERVEPIASRARRRRQINAPQQDYLDLEALADALNQPAAPGRTVEDGVKQIRHFMLQSAPVGQDPALTLDRLLDSELLVDEVEPASAELEHLFSKFDPAREYRTAGPASGFQIRAVDLPTSTCLSHDDEVASLSTAYELIVANWIGPLPSHTAGRIRLAKRERACRIAVELILAGRRLQPAIQLDNPESQLSGKESHDPVETWDLPVRATRAGLQSWPSSSSVPRPLAQPSSLPTPSPTASPSIITASSRMSTAAPQLDRLAAYTTFTKPAPLVLPRSLSNVLSHWAVGSDPNDYDWMSKSRHISKVEEDDDNQGLTEKERRRAQRQAERHLRRQRKEAAASQALQMASSQAADVLSTSQPGVPKTASHSQQIGLSKSNEPDSQSQNQGREAVASQIVRGRHGGRPPKKRRKDGF